MTTRLKVHERPFVDHEGGPCPVPPDADVWVRTRNGQLVHMVASRLHWNWSDDEHRDDIVAYSVVEAA